MPRPSHRAEATTWWRRFSPVTMTLLVVVLVLPLLAGIAGPRILEKLETPRGAVALDPVGAQQDDEDAVVATDVPSEVTEGRHLLVNRAFVRRQRERREARQEAREARRAARAARQAEREAAKKAEAALGAPFTVRIGSFNVLGSQHTAPGGDRQRYPVASTRTAGGASLLAEHGVDIVGMQEIQADQLRDYQNRTGMAAYPGFSWGEAETDNSILYDPGVFEMVSGSQFTITFMNRARPQPILRLRHRASGAEFYVVNTHPSAGGGAYASQRRAAQSTLVGVVNNLKAEGLPVFVTGDMNDREAFYCNVVPPTGLRASNGGGGTCGSPPPSPIPVDWVVGHGVTWSGYWRDMRSTTRRISDHILISALAHVN